MKQYILLFSLVSTMAIAQTQTPSVQVVGEGIVYVTPDVVNISISIEREGLDLKNLRQKNSEEVAKVLETLSKELPKENFQTSYVSLYKDDYNKINKYRVLQNITIKLEDISKYDSLMNAIFDAGVNRINSVSFDVKNKEKHLQDAVKELSSNFNDVQPTFRSSKMSLGSSGAEANDTLAIGKIAVEAQINVAFELFNK